MNKVQWAALVGGLCITAPASAVAPQRTFVASYGQDTNPCSLTAPCRGFQAAIDAVTAGGEVVALDSAGYGTFVINKAASISAPDGVYAGITVSGAGKGIDVVMGMSQNVRLRGLTITSQSGQNAIGINFNALGILEIERMRIDGMATAIAIGGATRALIRDTFLFNNEMGIGIVSGTVFADVTIERTTISQSSYAAIQTSGAVELTIDHALLANPSGTMNGIQIKTSAPDVGPARAHISNSTIRGFTAAVNTQVIGAAPPITVSIGGSEISQSWTAIRMEGSAGELALDGNRLTHLTYAFEISPGATVFTSGTNYIADYGVLQTGGGTLAPPGGRY